jgi:hypothetical protein
VEAAEAVEAVAAEAAAQYIFHQLFYIGFHVVSIGKNDYHFDQNYTPANN